MEPLSQKLIQMGTGKVPTGYWISEITGPSTSISPGNVGFYSDGGVCGNAVLLTPIFGGSNTYTYRLGPNGNIVWHKFFNAELRGLNTDAAGKSYLSGYRYGAIDTESFTSIFARYSSSGVLEFQRYINLTDEIDLAQATDVDDSGNIYVCGFINSSPQYGYIGQFDSTGDILWQRTSINARFSGIAVNNFAEIYVSGGYGVPLSNRLIAKFGSGGLGSLTWAVAIGSSGNSDAINGIAVGYRIVLTGEPDIPAPLYVVGETKILDGSNFALFIVKYTPSGSIEWQRGLFASGTPSRGYKVAVAPDNSQVVIGTLGSAIIVAKFDTSGVLAWQRLLTNGTATLEPSGIAINASGEVCITGRLLSTNKIFTAKLRGDGSELGPFDGYTFSVATATIVSMPLSNTVLSLSSSTSSLATGDVSLTNIDANLSQTNLVIL